jgi:beta-fructofuranosidase
MSLPRRLTLLGRDELGIEPAGDIASLRGEHHYEGPVQLPANEEVVLDSVRGNAMEVLAQIDTNDAPMVELSVLRAPDRQEFTRIVFFRERGYRDWDRYAGWEREQLRRATYSLITIDSSYSSVLPDVLSRAPETGPVFLEPDEPLTLHVFLDKSIIEVFVNGKQCLAMRVYPGREDSVGVSLRAQGRSAVLTSLDAWRMQSIHDRSIQT